MIFPEPVPLTQQAGPRTYLEKSYGPLKLTCCVKNVFFVGIPQLDLFFGRFYSDQNPLRSNHYI